MNAKRLLLMAAFAALATLVAPNAFAAVANQGNIQVLWNAQAISKMTIQTNYVSVTGAASASAPTVIAPTGQVGTCTAAGGGAAEANNVTANFGNITPDSSSNTLCDYKNGVALAYSTTDSNGYNVTAAETAATLPAGTTYASGAGAHVWICLMPNGTAAATATGSAYTAATLAATQINMAPGTCTGGNSVGAGTPSAAINSSGASQSSTVYDTEDILTDLGNTVTSGASNVTVQFTLNAL